MKILTRSGNDLITTSYNSTTSKITVTSNNIGITLKKFKYWNSFAVPEHDSQAITRSDYVILVILLGSDSQYINHLTLEETSLVGDFSGISSNSAYAILAVAIRKSEIATLGNVTMLHQNGIAYSGLSKNYYINQSGADHNLTSNANTLTLISTYSSILDYLSDSDETAELYPMNTWVPCFDIFGYMKNMYGYLSNFSFLYSGNYDTSKTELLLTSPSAVPTTHIMNGVSNTDQYTLEQGLWTYKISLYDSGSTLIDEIEKTLLFVTTVKSLFFPQINYNNPLQFSFTSYSIGDDAGAPFTYYWDFGDGSGTSTLATPSYTYAASGLYTVKLTVTKNVNGVNYSDTFEGLIRAGVIDCTSLIDDTFYKKACHEYVIKETEHKDVERTIKIVNYNQEVLEEISIPINVELQEITTPSDGIYVIQIWFDEDGSMSLFKEFPIYDLCETYECYMNLVKALQCCDNDGCNEDLEKISDEREGLNRLNGLIYLLDQWIKMETDSYLGVYTIDATRSELIGEIQDIFQKISVVVSKCTGCMDTKTESGCSSCN